MAAPIISIRGLQNLQGLISFDADYNGLSTINLSNMPNLFDVDISDCDIPGTNTPSLTSFNFSGSNNIEELRMDDSNFSGGINVSNLSDLYWLDVDQCNLPSLDVSGLSSLYYLDAWGNENMTSLNITGCQSLVDIYADECALTEASVNAILIELDNLGNTGGYINISGGTNAAPTGLGIAAVISLMGKGWNLSYNGPTITTTTTAAPTTTSTTSAVFTTSTTTEVPTTTTTTI